MANSKFQINAEDINKEGLSSKALDQRDAGIAKRKDPKKAEPQATKEPKAPKERDPRLEKLAEMGIRTVRLLPIVLFGFGSILLVRRIDLTRPMEQLFWSPLGDDSLQTDFFNYYKMLTVLFSALLAMLAAFFTAPPVGELRRRKASKTGKAAASLCAVYALTAAASYLACDYKAFALTGALDRFEGLLPTLAYLFMLLYIMTVVKSEKDLKFLLWPFTCVMGILGVLGVGQAIGKDFFRTTLGQQLITPLVKYSDGTTSWIAIATNAVLGVTTYDFKFGEGMVYQTVYNPNYVPFYLCLVLPVLAMLALLLWDPDREGGKKSLRLLGGAALLAVYGMALWSFFCANSASGYVGLAVMFVLALVLLRNHLIRLLKPLAVFVLVTAVVMGAVSDRWLPEVKKAAGLAAQALATPAYEEEGPATVSFEFEKAPASRRASIDKLVTGKNYVTMTVNGNDFMLIIDDAMICADGDQFMLPMLPIDDGSNMYYICDSRFHDYIKVGYVFLEKDPCLIIATYDYQWKFHLTDEGFKFVTPGSSETQLKETAIGEIPSVGFENNPKWGSNRGLLWSRTLPLLKSRLLIGEGPDCFVFAYPQEDYAAKYTVQRNPAIINNKPHNMYLQRAVETGFVSMLAYIGLIVLFLLDSFKNSCRLKGHARLAEYLGTGICMGVAAFAATGMLNDTTICTGPMFYTLMGVGFACNRMAEKEAAKAQPAVEAAETASEVA